MGFYGSSPVIQRQRKSQHLRLECINYKSVILINSMTGFVHLTPNVIDKNQILVVVYVKHNINSY